MVEVLGEFAKAVGEPWRWLKHVDRRPAMSMSQIQDYHAVTLALTDQWLVEDMGSKNKVVTCSRGCELLPTAV